MSIHSEEVILPCEFSHLSYYGYTCSIKSVKGSENTNVIGISGTHLVGYGNENVTRVDFESSTLANFPQIVFDTFNNLKHLHAIGVSMTNLNRLANCSKLTDLDLGGNRFQTMKNSTFEECGNLVSIGLHENRLTRLEPDTFKGLTELAFLNLSNTLNLEI